MDGTWTAPPSARVFRVALAASIIVALGVSIFLLLRRALGEIASPAAWWLLIPTAAMLVAWAWLVRLYVDHSTAVDLNRCAHTIIRAWLPTFAVLAFAIALSFPGTRIVDWLVWLAAIVAIALGPESVIPAPPRGRSKQSNRHGETLVHHIKRYRTPSGRELIRGTMRTEFAPGQRTATLYVAFCPPFEYLPQVEARAAGNSASVKMAQLLHNGVQLEVRLPRDAGLKQLLTVEFVASEPNANS